MNYFDSFWNRSCFHLNSLPFIDWAFESDYIVNAFSTSTTIAPKSQRSMYERLIEPFIKLNCTVQRPAGQWPWYKVLTWGLHANNHRALLNLLLTWSVIHNTAWNDCTQAMMFGVFLDTASHWLEARLKVALSWRPPGRTRLFEPSPRSVTQLQRYD